MKDLTLKAAILCSVFLIPSGVLAQSGTGTTNQTAASTEADESPLLTPEDLQGLVAPIALYPDTLLIQVLVAATYPLEVIKADRLVSDNAGVAPDELKPKIDEMGWDESVAVLAVAFPDVLADMASNLDWVETVGDAMLVQSEDVMAAVQVMRARADAAGTLASGEQQTVEVTQEQNGDQTIIIQPTDPQVVYVPQYNPQVVYVEQPNSGSNVGDAVTTGLIIWGTFALMDNIFGRNDPWHGYWGCRNCGGWHGRPVVRNPNFIVNGDVNIGRGNGNDIGWKPDPKRQRQARNDLARRRGPNGATTLPTRRTPSRGDSLRRNLSNSPGISRPNNPGANAGNRRPAKAETRRTPNAVDRTRSPATSRPRASKPARARAPERKPAASRGGAINQRAPASGARARNAHGQFAPGGKRRR